jgi:hypothetical protein
MKAIVHFSNNTSSLVRVNSSYSLAGIHYYNLTINLLKTFLDFSPGETKIFTQYQIKKLTYIMS